MLADLVARAGLTPGHPSPVRRLTLQGGVGRAAATLGRVVRGRPKALAVELVRRLGNAAAARGRRAVA